MTHARVLLATSLLLASASAQNPQKKLQPNPKAAAASREPLQQSPPSSPNPSSPAAASPQNPPAWQRHNVEAQTEYYKKQTEKLDNPDHFPYYAGFFAVAVGLAGAGVSLFTFFRGQKRSAEQQAETQFYEALKRLGDKDSPMIRASAVGLLYSMATRQSSPDEDAGQSPLFDLVFEHFNTAINLETNREVLNMLRARLTDLASFRPSLQVIRDSNLEAQRELARILADLFAVRGAGDPNEITLDDWSAASFATGLPKRALQTLTARFHSAASRELTQGKYFPEILRTARDRASLLNPPALVAEGEEAINSARTFAQRLQVNVELWMRCFARPQAAGELGFFSELFLNGITIHSKVLNSVNIDNLQMQDAQLSDIRLDGASLRFGHLEGTKFYDVDLSGADLTGAHLEGVTLGGNTTLIETKLHLAHVDASTDFGILWLRANYREADVIFTNASPADSFRLFADKKLLDQLFSKWIRLHASLKGSNPVRLISDISNRSSMMRFQEELKSAHPSVREYVRRFCPELFDPVAPPAT